MDLDVPNALPTMVCKPPTINGRALGIENTAEVRAMPGITDVVLIPHSQFVAGGVADHVLRYRLRGCLERAGLIGR